MLNTKSLTVIFFLIICFAIARAPASLIERFLNDQPNNSIRLSNSSGTIWYGSGIIDIGNFTNSQISWSITLWDLSSFSPGIIWDLKNRGSTLNGKSVFTGQEVETSLNGTLSSTLLNNIFGPYDISLDGDLLINNVSATHNMSENFSFKNLNGKLIWSGGAITYMLSRVALTIDSPVFQISLSDQPKGVIEAMLTSPELDYTLLSARLNPDGFLNVSVSKGFTKIFGNEWPGSQTDDRTIIELEEKIF